MGVGTKHYIVSDVAKMFGVRRQTVHFWIDRGRFDGVFRVGREWVFSEGTRVKEFDRQKGPSGKLDAYIEECEERSMEPVIPVHDFFRTDGKASACAIPSEIEQRRVKRDIRDLEAEVSRLALQPYDTAERFLQTRAVLKLAAARLEELGDEEMLPLVREELERE